MAVSVKLLLPAQVPSKAPKQDALNCTVVGTARCVLYCAETPV